MIFWISAAKSQYHEVLATHKGLVSRNYDCQKPTRSVELPLFSLLGFKVARDSAVQTFTTEPNNDCCDKRRLMAMASARSESRVDSYLPFSNSNEDDRRPYMERHRRPLLHALELSAGSSDAVTGRSPHVAGCPVRPEQGPNGVRKT
ncbi:hypothetical protein NL676_022765 [Syzygium grande]|nr:hypothetical protein NL676_022765 [Syzygium grande]